MRLRGAPVDNATPAHPEACLTLMGICEKVISFVALPLCDESVEIPSVLYCAASCRLSALHCTTLHCTALHGTARYCAIHAVAYHTACSVRHMACGSAVHVLSDLRNVN